MESNVPILSAHRAGILRGYQIMDTEAEQLFDDLVYLAADICEVPIALVALVDDHREWFKAKIGFEAPEIPLESSIAAHGLAEEDLFVIPDLKRDERTAENPLVMGPPRLRFYAAAPIITSSGDTLGMLAVIDHYPRTSGLTTRQRRALTSLGRQVTMSIDMHRLLCEFSVMPRG